MVMRYQSVTVFYDGACPMCRREIAYYQRLDHGGRLKWVDVSTSDVVCPDGFCRVDLLQRFHVQSEEGQVYRGAAGFARLWLQLPVPWRYAGKVAMWPPVTVLLELVYVAFLLLRPALQRVAHRRSVS
jgi:predicted DCC family thiol-disulfide oxidoreductase YuxK